MPTTNPPKFTLRFRNENNHRMLGLLAEHFGVSKNQLAEEMLERELQAAALLLESDLTDTLSMLRNYRREEHLDDAIAEFARAEADETDPVATRMASPLAMDAFGVVRAFTEA